MIRSVSAVSVAAAAMLLPSVVLADQAIKAPNLKVGRNLQMYATVRLVEAAPQTGVTLTLTSEDPSRLLLSKNPEQAGSASITLNVLPKFFESPDFWVQGKTDSGAVSYSVSSPGIETVKAKVDLVPSAVVITGPFRLPSFTTTPRGQAIRLTLVTTALGPDFKVLEEQGIAGGSEVEIELKNSNAEVGKLGATKVKIPGGSSYSNTFFQPAAAGNATLAPVQPPGFTTPAEWANVTAAIDKPGMAIVDDVFVGKDLQLSAVLCLGEPAPAGGIDVTLTSSDPKKLVLSAKDDQLGTGTLVLKVPEGQLVANYFLQGLGDSGEVTYKATAEGYRSRIAKTGLAPSGMIVAYERYGPPDEANVLRKHGADEDDRKFFVSMAASKERLPQVVVWTVHLGIQGRAADITVQPLRPGVTATVKLTSSQPGIGTVESPLLIKSGVNHVVSTFTPLSKGETIITVDTPTGFTRPKNATAVPAQVAE